MNIARLERGSGPTMLFFHNGGSNRDLWSRQVDHFSKNFRTIAVDLPGYGDGEELNGDATLERYRGFVRATVRELCPNEKPILVGHCIGAAMVLAATLEEPTMARGVILFNVATEAGIRTGSYGKLLGSLRRAPALVRAASWLAQHSPAWARRASLREHYPNAKDDPYFERLVEMSGAPKHLKSLAAIAPAMATYEAVQAFDKPTGFPPAMLIWGSENRVLPLETAAAVRQSLRPDVYLEIRAGHFTMRERADEVNERVSEFVANHFG